ncbi:MAG: hypothetical protein ABH831_00945 [Candidatus Nealsonbacteria bacterium]
MLWLIIAISAYFVFAAVFLVDKYLLTGPISNPKVYAFYVGILGILVLVVIPFTGFYVPNFSQILISILAGSVFLLAIFWLFRALKSFEPSRVVPAVGGMTPLFSLAFIYIFSKGKEIIDPSSLLAFLLLILGTILITYQKSKITLDSLKISAIAAFLFGLYFVLIKYIFLEQTFWNGLIWIRIGGTIAALLFLFKKEVREELKNQKANFEKKNTIIFLANQAAGATATILQYWAISLVPLSLVVVVPALQGSQYVFLLILAIFLSIKFPKVLREEISKKVLAQKLIAILLICGGLVLLVI